MSHFQFSITTEELSLPPGGAHRYSASIHSQSSMDRVRLGHHHRKSVSTRTGGDTPGGCAGPWCPFAGAWWGSGSGEVSIGMEGWRVEGWKEQWYIFV